MCVLQSYFFGEGASDYSELSIQHFWVKYESYCGVALVLVAGFFAGEKNINFSMQAARQARHLLTHALGHKNYMSSSNR